MKLLRTLVREYSGMMAILGLLLVPFLVLLLYTNMRVEVALLERSIRISTMKKERLVKKNDALRDEVAELEGNSMEKLYWKRYGALPIYIRNRVVNVRLPEKLRDEGEGIREEEKRTEEENPPLTSSR